MDVIGFITAHAEAIAGAAAGAGVMYAMKQPVIKRKLKSVTGSGKKPQVAAPEVFKCNARRFLFQRMKDGKLEKASSIHHPVCDGLDLADLTEDFAKKSRPGWTLAECRDEVHYVETA